MPAKCYFCVNELHHADPENCTRLMVTPEEALSFMVEPYHSFVSCGLGLLGCDSSLELIEDLLKNAKYIEIACTDGVARAMKHGLCVHLDGVDYFYEADEELLKSYEEKYLEK